MSFKRFEAWFILLMFFGLRKIAPLGTYLPRCKVKDLPLRVPPLTSSLERQAKMQGAQYFLTHFIMATRATITVSDQYETFHIYHHMDGYPSNIILKINAALTYAWPLPRYEPGDIGAAFIRAAKTSSGNVYLTADASETLGCGLSL